MYVWWYCVNIHVCGIVLIYMYGGMVLIYMYGVPVDHPNNIYNNELHPKSLVDCLETTH